MHYYEGRVLTRVASFCEGSFAGGRHVHAGSTTHTCFAKPSVLDLLPPAHATYLRHVYSRAVSDLDMHLRMLSSGTGHLVHAD